MLRDIEGELPKSLEDGEIVGFGVLEATSDDELPIEEEEEGTLKNAEPHRAPMTRGTPSYIRAAITALDMDLLVILYAFLRPTSILFRTKTVDNRYGLWNWLSPATPFDDWTPVSGGETKKRRKKEAMQIRLYAVLEDSPVRMAKLPYEVAGDTKKRWITVIGGMKPPAWNREVDPEAFRIEYFCEGENQPFFVKRAPSFSELQKAIRPYGVQDEWTPLNSLEDMKEPDREEEWKQVFPHYSEWRSKTILQALAESPIHAASLLYSSSDLITPRRYLVTDNAPDKEWKHTVIYRYRVEWWDEGYEHYRSLVFADNYSALASPLSPASTTGDWQPVLTNDEET